MKKNDIYLIAGILLIALVFWAGMKVSQLTKNDEGAVVVVSVDGKEYGKYPLEKDLVKRIEFNDGSFNEIEIKDGCVSVTKASCPDQICVKHNHISKSNESIVCLPNKLVIEIEKGMTNDIDAVTY